MKLLPLLLFLLSAAPLLAGLPEIAKLKADDKIIITVVYGEPQVTEFKYVFTASSVAISRNEKTLGKLAITVEDAVRIDQHLWAVERGKKAGRNALGAPSYGIKHENSGKTIGTWAYQIVKPKESKKPVISLEELRQR